ncbi:MAG: T9SS type A sorting domain-containing protein [Bacteroidia bacterium]
MKTKVVWMIAGLCMAWMQAHGQCSAYFTLTSWSSPVATLTANLVPGLTYNWSLYNGGGVLTSNQNVATVNITPGMAPTVILNVTGPGCNSRYAHTLGYMLPPFTMEPIPAMGPTTVCGSNITYYTTYHYAGAGMGSCYLLGAFDQGGTIVYIDYINWPDYNVEQRFYVDWNPSGVGKIITAHGLCSYPQSVAHCTTSVALSCGLQGPQSLCIGDTAEYRQFCPTGSTYLWSAGSGTIVSGQSTDRVRVVWPGPGADTVVTISNSTTCGVDTNYYPVTIYPYPTNSILSDTSGCELTLDTLATSPLPALSPPNVTNSWRVTGGGLNLTASNQNPYQYVHGSGPVETVILTTNDHGCISHDTIQLTIHPLPAPPIPQQPIICTGDSVLLDAGPGYATYAWSTGSSLSSIFASTASPYTVSVTDPVHHCLGTATATPIIDPDCVWPGDANHDYVADLNDFLAIGVAFGDTGSARPNAVSTWMGQPAQDWLNWFPNGTNYKHADSDGNGLVDFPDTVSVSLHQGLTHLKTGTVTGGVPLLIRPRMVPFAGQDSVELIVTLGDGLFPADSVYGLSFQMHYDPSDVFAGVSGRASNSYLGNPNNQLMQMQDEDANAGRFAWAMVRNDHQPASGYGEVCRLKLQARPALWSGQGMTMLPLSISDCRLIGPTGVDIPVTAVMDTVWLYDLMHVGEAEATTAEGLEVSPNPAHGFVQLRIPSRLVGTCDISLKDLSGKTVLQETHRVLPFGRSTEVAIHVEHLASGIYALHLETSKETLIVKVTVVN